MRSLKTVVAAALVVGYAGIAEAEELVYGQRPGAWQPVWYIEGDANGAVADDFVLGADTTMLSATFWGWEVTDTGMGFPDLFTVSVWSDEGGGNGVDDAGLIYEEDFSFASLDPTGVFGGTATRFTAAFSTPFDLDGATTYWFAVGFKDGDADYGWMQQGLSGPDAIGTAPLDYDRGYDGWDGPFDTGPGGGLAFSLMGEPSGAVIPLPTVAAMGGLGLAGVAVRRRRNSM